MRKRKSFRAFTRFLRVIHARTCWVLCSTRAVDHVLCYQLMQFRVNSFVGNLACHDLIDVLSSRWLVGQIFHYEEDVNMRKPAFLDNERE